MTAATVYKLYREDTLLYVGITSAGIRRFEQHRRLRSFWPEITRAEFLHFETQAAAEDEERRLIRELRPEHNERAKPTLVPHGMASIDEIATFLSVHRQTVRHLVARGKLPVAGHTARAVPYFDVAEVDAWVRAGKAALPLNNGHENDQGVAEGVAAND